VAAVHRDIHDWLAARGSPQGRVIYGGSVNLDNCEALLAQPGVDGLFVGRAALDPEVFSRIAHAPIPHHNEPGPADRTGDRAFVSGEAP
jgi:triosephosphate isomerase